MTADGLKPAPDWVDEMMARKPWEATITPDRYGYWITFHAGLTELRRDGGWWRPTRRGAERCARRVIARENAETERLTRRWTVR